MLRILLRCTTSSSPWPWRYLRSTSLTSFAQAAKSRFLLHPATCSPASFPHCASATCSRGKDTVCCCETSARTPFTCKDRFRCKLRMGLPDCLNPVRGAEKASHSAKSARAPHKQRSMRAPIPRTSSFSTREDLTIPGRISLARVGYLATPAQCSVPWFRCTESTRELAGILYTACTTGIFCIAIVYCQC